MNGVLVVVVYGNGEYVVYSVWCGMAVVWYGVVYHVVYGVWSVVC